MSTCQHFKTTFKHNLTCIFLSLRAKLKKTLCPRTPCNKTTIFNDLDYKAGIGQHFHKSEKSARWCHRHKIIKTNLKTHISPLLMRPQGSQGCQKIRQDPLKMPLEVWCAKIIPKLKNIQKYLRKQAFFDIFSSTLMVFLSLCLLGAILAQNENSFICEKKNLNF